MIPSLNNRAIIVTGMHRSGTSLMASWLHASGVKMGDNLIGPTYGNPRGHFENRAFVELQQSWIEANGFEFVLPADAELKLSEADLDQARNLIERHRSNDSAWGWKDPRSLLFLDAWHQLLPDCLVIIMSRPWRQVIHSLLRRDRRQVASAPKSWLVPLWHHPHNRLLVNDYINTWIRYNKHAVLFLEKNPNQVVLIQPYQLIRKQSLLTNQLVRLGLRLEESQLQFLVRPNNWVEDERLPCASLKLIKMADELQERLTNMTRSRF